MRIDVVTLFPAMFQGVLGESILKIAQEKRVAEINLVNLRDFTTDRHKKVDAPPYGGGPGMVIMADPVFRAVERLRADGRAGAKLVMLSPAGRKLTQRLAKSLAREAGLILLCGHYEGFDERIAEGLKPLEVSIGDYVLTGGEVPAMVLIDAVVRLLPGAVGCAGSVEDESFAAGTLEHPHYTKPRMYRGMAVPDVLVSGHHAKIDAWRRKRAEERTAERRPDLLRKRASKKER